MRIQRYVIERADEGDARIGGAGPMEVHTDSGVRY
jgi:hypothetical protein